MVDLCGERSDAVPSRLRNTWSKREFSAATEGSSGARTVRRRCVASDCSKARAASLTQFRHVRRTRCDGQFAGLDARDFQEVCRQLAQPVGLLVDDLEGTAAFSWGSGRGDELSTVAVEP